MRLCIITAAIALSACGTTNPSPSETMATLTGGVSGTVTTTVVAATDSAGGVGFALSTTSTNPSLDVAISLTGTTLQTGNYTESSASVSKAGITVSGSAASPPPTWAMFARESGSADQGSFSLDITSAGNSETGSSGTAWPDPHGTLTATLPAITVTGATGDTTLTVSF